MQIPRSTLVFRSAVLALFAVMLLAAASHAGPLGVFGGFDHYTGAFGQRTDGWIAGASLATPAADVAVAGVRYDDTLIGKGYSLTGVVGFTMAPLTQLRLAATQFVGDESFRAWRTKVGPRFSVPTGQSLWLAYVHYQDNADGHSDGAMAEATTPLIAGLTGRANASYATAAQGPAALQGAIGLGWQVVPHLELSGEVGVARNAAGASGQPVPGGGLLGFPPFGGGGGGPSAQTTNDVAGTALIGIRVLLP